MKISVIIPVYRVEHTLRRCVDSILRQDFTDWEMILVDDGSDDASPQICDEYAAKDPRIRTVHQPNRGLGAARNTGMDVAHGELIMFADSDDYVGEGTLGALAAYMDHNEDVDMAEFPFERIRAGRQSELITFTPHTYTDPIAYFFKEEAYTHSYAWNKIYRRTTLGNVRFVERKKFEDMLTLPRFLKACRKIGMTSVGRYVYVDNPDGITAKAGKELAHLLEAHSAMMDIIGWECPQGIREKLFARYYAHVLNIQIDVYRFVGRKMLLIRRMRYFGTPKLAMVAILGVERTCRIMKTIYKTCKNNR